MAPENPWYSLIPGDKPLNQGDLIRKCPIIIPPKVIQKKMDASIKEINALIITQSCDIVQDKTDNILVCACYTLEQLENITFFKDPVGKEVLRRGNIVYLHLLNRCTIPGWESSFMVADFRKVYSINKKLLDEVAKTQGQRIGLLSPYREQLSQSFARYIMRVGLPEDIPPFAGEIYQLEVKSN